MKAKELASQISKALWDDCYASPPWETEGSITPLQVRILNDAVERYGYTPTETQILETAIILGESVVRVEMWCVNLTLYSLTFAHSHPRRHIGQVSEDARELSW